MKILLLGLLLGTISSTAFSSHNQVCSKYLTARALSEGSSIIETRQIEFEISGRQFYGKKI